MDINDYLKSLGAENFDATFDNSYMSPEDHYEAVEIENYLQATKRYPGNTARQTAARIVKSPAARAEMKNEMKRAGIASAFVNPAMPGSITSNLSAQVNFQIVRNTATIAQDLPVPLFGAFDSANNYANVLQLPTGVSISNIDFGGALKPNTVTITYTSGANSDTVDVTCQEYAYTSFLRALATARFTISNARYTISDTGALGVQQLSKKLQAQTRSMFGKVVTDNIPLGASKSPFQQQNGIVDILGSFTVTPEVTWALDFQALANQQVTVSAFITQTDKGILG
jgi:hypothetical protein